MPTPPRTDIRPLRTHAELRQCLALQRATWGERFDDAVPASILSVVQRIGGVAAGAFDEAGQMLGFVFGITGVEQGRIVHWSDMLAVIPEARDRGIGRMLKQYQRRMAESVGAEVMYWTYDPLVARNAHLNIDILGARPTEYVRDMYGDTGSVLHAGIGTDRFVVAWPLGRPAAPDPDRPDDARALAAPVLNALPDEPGAAPAPVDAERLPDVVRVAIPLDIQAVLARDERRAAAWRASTREALERALALGYRVTRFVRDDAHGFYVLTPSSRSRAAAEAAAPGATDPGSPR